MTRVLEVLAVLGPYFRPYRWLALVILILFVVVFVMCECRISFIHHYHADVILYPVLTAHSYFLFWISLFLSLEVVSHQRVFM